jgi:hypothetical protein
VIPGGFNEESIVLVGRRHCVSASLASENEKRRKFFAKMKEALKSRNSDRTEMKDCMGASVPGFLWLQADFSKDRCTA